MTLVDGILQRRGLGAVGSERTDCRRGELGERRCWVKASSAQTQRHLSKVNKQLTEDGTLSADGKETGDAALKAGWSGSRLGAPGQSCVPSSLQGSAREGQLRARDKTRTLCYNLSARCVEPAWEEKGRSQAGSNYSGLQETM